MEVVQYIGGCSVHRGNSIRTVRDSFSTVEVAQYSGDNISTVELTSVLWRVFGTVWIDTFSTVGGNSSTCGGNSSTCGGYLQYCGDTFSTAEVVKYNGG